MADKKHFVNPLTRSSEVELHLPVLQAPISRPEEPAERPVTTTSPQYAKGKGERFESIHQRFTIWIDRGIKTQFDELLAKKGGTKTELLNEAITLLLQKHNRKPYTKHSARSE